MISGNLHILMKCSSAWYLCYHFISEDEQFSCKSIWFDILLKTHCSQKQPPEVFATLLKWDSNTGVFLWNLLSFYEHLFWTTSALLCIMVSCVVAATQRTKTSSWPFLAYQEIEKSAYAKKTLRNLASISLSI